MSNRAEVAERIRRLLLSRRMSQRELARSIGVSDAAVSKYLSGERPIRRAMLWAIARALETSESFLLGEPDDAGAKGKSAELAKALAIIERYRADMTDAEKVQIAMALFKKAPPMPSQEGPSGCPTCLL